VTIVVGNPKPHSRTRKVAETLVEKLLKPSSYELHVIDLAEYSEHVFTWPSDLMDSLNAEVVESDLAVFASPTYKATYTGLLKAFLDRYAANGLRGVTAIPLLTGADQTHAMGPNVNLAPLLVELGAVVPGPGLYFITSQMDRLEDIVEAAAANYSFNFSQLVSVARCVRPVSFSDGESE